MHNLKHRNEILIVIRDIHTQEERGMCASENLLTKKEVIDILGLGDLEARALFMDPGFPSRKVCLNGRTRDMVEALDLVAWMNYNGGFSRSSNGIMTV